MGFCEDTFRKTDADLSDCQRFHTLFARVCSRRMCYSRKGAIYKGVCFVFKWNASFRNRFIRCQLESLTFVRDRTELGLLQSCFQA